MIEDLESAKEAIGQNILLNSLDVPGHHHCIGGWVRLHLQKNNGNPSASYAFSRIISCIAGDISQEVIEDPALDEMWDKARRTRATRRWPR